MSFEVLDRIFDDAAFAKLEGWMSPEKAKRIARLVVETAPRLKPTLFVELGVFGGRGVICAGLTIKHMLEGQGYVYGIDPYTSAASLEGTQSQVDADWWSKLDYAAIESGCRAAIASYGLNEIVQLEIKRSQDVVDRYAPGSIHVLHFDANHSPEVSCQEVESWAPKMASHSYFVFDDVDWPSTHKAQGMLVDRFGFKLTEHHTKWAIYRAP